MTSPFPFNLLDDPKLLAANGSWSEEEYRDLMSFHDGLMSEEAFRGKYETTAAILILDMTGFTQSATAGELASFVRILRVQKLCVPALSRHNANHVRSFADDLYATYPDANNALDAALEVHRSIRLFNASASAGKDPAECCIGLGYGKVLRLGLDHAMGAEMNRASKLGEDMADGYETLVTEQFHEQVEHRKDCLFERRAAPEFAFPFYSITEKQ